MFLFTGIATVWKTTQGADGGEWFSKYLMPNVAIEASALYTFFLNRVSKVQFSEKVSAIIFMLSEYSFGTYLIHALVLDVLADICLGTMYAHPLSVIALSLILTYTISTGLTALIRKIPVIGKEIT